MDQGQKGAKGAAEAVPTTAVVLRDEPDPGSYAQMTLNSFWPQVMGEVRRIKVVDAKNQQLPLARIKKIMKLDEDVKMISAEAPLLFAKAAEIFIHELTLMAWVFTEENKRRTLQRSDIAMALSKYDQFDFLIDIVPREELRPAPKKEAPPPKGEGDPETPQGVVLEVADPLKPDSSAQIQYYLQLAQQQRQAISAEASNAPVAAQAPPALPVQVAGGQTVPLATLLAQQQQQQPQQSLLNQIQFQAQPQQIITLSNGQQLLLGGGGAATQHHQGTSLLTAGGQVIGSIPQPQQQQFHILQQIMSPTGEIQHIQVSGTREGG